jgi:hypothetical protein
MERERIAGFEDIYSPELSSPFEYVLKDVPVDRPKVLSIEPSLYRLVLQFHGPAGCGYCLEFAELVEVTKIPKVFKKICSGIDVWVHIGGLKAHPRRCPSLLR